MIVIVMIGCYMKEIMIKLVRVFIQVNFGVWVFLHVKKKKTAR
jgi:hypothetical protein